MPPPRVPQLDHGSRGEPEVLDQSPFQQATKDSNLEELEALERHVMEALKVVA